MAELPTIPNSEPLLDAGREAILRSCAILFLSRAMRSARDEADRCRFESQIVELVRELTGATGGAAILGNSRTELSRLVSQRAARETVEHVTVEALIEEHGRIAGVLAVWFYPATGEAELERALDTLSGIATLAGSAFEGTSERIYTADVDKTPQGPVPNVCGVIGESPAMDRMRRIIERVAPSDSTVLIEGESGAGKEVIARALHDRSKRASRPFVAINCATLSENLLESELFGHERGAFTGAVAQRRGKFELANGGTIFLDEIGEMALGLQARLLRVLQEREFERVGGSHTLPLDIRVVAATNRDLRAQVKKGEFREDLFHRLNVISIAAPALRDRPADIMPLARHFLLRSLQRSGRAVSGFSAEARLALMHYSWPGNVRELENAIERAVVMGDTELIEFDDLPDAVRKQEPLVAATAAASASDFEMAIGGAKRDSILRAWAESGGDYREAARLLGLHPNSVLRLVRKLNLRSSLGV